MKYLKRFNENLLIEKFEFNEEKSDINNKLYKNLVSISTDCLANLADTFFIEINEFYGYYTLIIWNRKSFTFDSIKDDIIPFILMLEEKEIEIQHNQIIFCHDEYNSTAISVDNIIKYENNYDELDNSFLKNVSIKSELSNIKFYFDDEE
jgi:hypothetical protein